ncbi:Na(+)-translocating NADH-quinone reductase subunit F [Chlamydia abortus]|uniref:2Fe-2S iron-sulfur cluster-binding protein n=1 Tax=Paenibacillus residui TaxID=629724 RepID=A0ABW3D679_9BACL|nr:MULTISPECIES: 2Fe-2S iron-sulfur cluster-binding protein [Paenibacillaceae]SHE11042.1 Na(+)-translocating NADH-quinone reductase subunit F [Chlamydia abortus]
MLELVGRFGKKTVQPETGLSILELALKNNVDWGFSCTRGTCARCRCYISQGMELLEEPTEAEIARLDPEEFDEGFRLGCQARIKEIGPIKATNKTYF